MRRSSWTKMLLMTEGLMGRYSSKAAAGVVRYCRDEVVALLDSQHVGSDVESILGCGGGLPVVGDVASALPLGPKCLVIGVAPVGGGLPDGWRKHLIEALDAGLDLVSGLHQFLNDDEELAEHAKRTGAVIHDVRRPRSDIPIGSNLAARLDGKRVLTVGSDGNIGKMHTSIELTRELERRGRDADFVATGQIGIMISGRGVPLDHVVSDFVSGAIEQELIQREQHEVYLVEGQGAIIHPGFSAVTVGLIHGAAPDAMVFCHNPMRCVQRHGVEIPPLNAAIRLHEDLCRYVHPCKVIAVSLNCAELSDAEARDAVQRVQNETGLPATDPVKFGAGPLADAVEGIL
jgi:uncharacterized NAD-dependent epimerase/dehydratase family protein